MAYMIGKPISLGGLRRADEDAGLVSHGFLLRSSRCGDETGGAPAADAANCNHHPERLAEMRGCQRAGRGNTPISQRADPQDAGKGTRESHRRCPAASVWQQAQRSDALWQWAGPGSTMRAIARPSATTEWFGIRRKDLLSTAETRPVTRAHMQAGFRCGGKMPPWRVTASRAGIVGPAKRQGSVAELGPSNHQKGSALILEVLGDHRGDRRRKIVCSGLGINCPRGRWRQTGLVRSGCRHSRLQYWAP